MSWWSPVVTKSPAGELPATSSGGRGEDAALIRALADGSRDAFSAIYQQHGQRVFRVAYQHAASREIADEVAQETFLLLLREPGKFDPDRGELGAFLAGVARQLARKALSQANRLAGEALDENSALDSAGASRVLDELADRQEWQLLHEAVATLPEPYRESLVMHHLEGLSYEETAEALRCPVGTVRSRLARAREMLARKLSGFRGDARGQGNEHGKHPEKGGPDHDAAK